VVVGGLTDILGSRVNLRCRCCSLMTVPMDMTMPCSDQCHSLPLRVFKVFHTSNTQGCEKTLNCWAATRSRLLGCHSIM
jgi:hypothetical protein